MKLLNVVMDVQTRREKLINHSQRQHFKSPIFFIFTQHSKSPAGVQEQREEVVMQALFIQRSGLTDCPKQSQEICKNNWNNVPLTPENASTVLQRFKWSLRTK